MNLRLLPKMLLFILFPAIAGLGILTFAGNRLADEGMRQQISEDLQLAVDLQARELGNITDLVHNIAGYLSESGVVQSYLASVVRREPIEVQDRLRKDAQQETVTLANSFARIRDVALINVQGEIVAHTDPKSVGTKVADRSYFKEAMAGNRAAATVVSRADNSTITMLSVPVKADGKVVGVAYASLHMANLADSTTNAIKVARTGVCYVYDKDGRTIMHPNVKMVGDDNKDHPWTWAIMKDPKTAINYNWNGVDKVAHYARVPNTGWWVVLGVDEEDVFLPVTNMTHNLLIIAGLVTLVVGLVIFFMAKGLASVLREGATFTAFVAEGNLDVDPALQSKLQVACKRGDEIGLLARSVGTLVTNLAGKINEAHARSQQAEEAMTEAHAAKAEAEASAAEALNARREGMLSAAEQLESVVAVISSASSQLAAQIEQSERGSAQQAARLAETATAMEEMNSTVLEVARNAANASEVSTSTRHKAEEGASVVLKVVDGIKEVQTQSLRMKEDMGRLDQNAQAISNIMGVISDIADQTNLLALNAAIEAARAGEAGRGFAVVADEVRKLAEKTMTSTTDVGNAIRAIQKSATESMTQVDSSVAAVEHATEFANQSGVALREIVSLVDNSADQVRAIATASEQQSSSSEEINSSITQINSIAGETARAMQEAAQAVSDLARQAQILGNLIEDMKRG